MNPVEMENQNAPDAGMQASSAEPGGRNTSMFRALKNPNYRLFFIGQAISLTGTWMQSVAESWLVYRLTGSAVLLGTVGFASQIPVFLLAPIGGLVADARDRRRVLITTQCIAMTLAFGLALLTLAGLAQVWHLVIFAVLLGINNAFDMPTRQSFVPEIVDREDLLNAIALNSTMFNGARVVGPAVAGLLVGAVGEGWCFLLNALSYVAVIAGLYRIHTERRETAESVTMLPEAPLARILEGFRYVAQTGPIRALILLLGVISLVGAPYATLMPIFVGTVLHGGSNGLGILLGASGVGALIGALGLAHRGASGRGVKGLGRAVWMGGAGFGCSLLLFAASRSFWLSALLLIPVGLCIMVQTASSNTLIQAMVPDDLRGRVMSVYSMMFMGMAPIGSLLAGTLAEHLGAPTTVALGAVASIVAALAFATRLPGLRAQARELLQARGATG